MSITIFDSVWKLSYLSVFSSSTFSLFRDINQRFLTPTTTNIRKLLTSNQSKNINKINQVKNWPNAFDKLLWVNCIDLFTCCHTKCKHGSILPSRGRKVYRQLRKEVNQEMQRLKRCIKGPENQFIEAAGSWYDEYD